MVDNKDYYYMKLAMSLARRGGKLVRPNPMVGAVIVKNSRIVGQGYHRNFGAEHAEILAIREAAQKARGATLYVNLEPCNHYGQTPPCTEAIISAGIKKVVAAVEDPNPLTSGRGIKRLKSSGIEVTTGILEQEARQLNEVFFKYITTKYPFTILKMASSLDGKIATRDGDAKWITSLPARSYVHRLRSQVDAVMVGVNTVLQDDPCLYPYLVSSKLSYPVRIIVDSRLRVPLEARIFKDLESSPVIVSTVGPKSHQKVKKLTDRGVEVILTRSKSGQVDLKDLFRILAQKRISLIMAEGGPTLATSLLEERLVDKIIFFISPLIIGGQKALTPVEGYGVACLSEALHLDRLKFRRIGKDVMIEAYPDYINGGEDVYRDH